MSPGANTWKLTEPLNGAKPPDRCATSWMFAPTITGPEASVLRLGVALLTVELSPASLQGVLTALLFASPE